jgi:hypothetical protein
MPGTTFAQTRWLLLAAVFTCCLPTAGEARRTVIDGNQYGTTYEISTDAEDGDGVALPFDVNYGSGLQSGVTVNFGPLEGSTILRRSLSA